MKFYLDKTDGTSKELTPDELNEYLSVDQVAEAIVAKYEDPLEEVSYLAVDGVIRVEF